MCSPAIQKEITTKRAAITKPNQYKRPGLFGLPEEKRSRAANKIRASEITSGARTGPAQTIGIKKRMSQSIKEAGQLRKIFSQT